MSIDDITIKNKKTKSFLTPLSYGSKTWITMRRPVHTTQVPQLKILRWLFGVTSLVKIRNEYVRGHFGTCYIADKF